MADDQTYERPTYASLSTPPRPAPDAASTGSRRSAAPWLLTAILAAFALGLIANPWFERNVRAHLPGMAAVPTPDRNAAAVAALSARLDRLEVEVRTAPPLAALAPAPATTAAKLEDLQDGLAGVAAKVDATAERADAALSSASQGAERAQIVLLVATVRHSLESGSPVAPLAPGLRKAFPRQEPAVTAILAASEEHITLPKLRADFLRLQQRQPAAASTWLGTLRQGLGDVVQVRRADSPAATGLTGRALASQRLLAGDVAGAVTALGPTANPAWLAEAQRWLAAQRGLTALEAAIVARS